MDVDQMDASQAFNLIVQVTGEVQANRAVHEKIAQALKVIQEQLSPEKIDPVEKD